MMNKIIFPLFFFISASLAQNVPLQNCSDDLAELSLQKRNLSKLFRECSNKKKDYSISIMSFKVAEGDYGKDEKAKCMATVYKDSLENLSNCLKQTHPEILLFSVDESLEYLLSTNAFDDAVERIKKYKQILENREGKEVLDKFNTYDEEIALENVSFENFNQMVSEWNGSREDKDMLRLYFKYIKAKYNYHFRCFVKSSFKCDTTWLGEEKDSFLKKYPESEYREFVETQMMGFPELTAEEKKQAKENNRLVKQRIHKEEMDKKIAERDVWVALTGIAMFGIPLTATESFNENFNVSSMFGVALRASYRRAFFQYQYNFSLGGNNKGGSVSEKSYSLLVGAAIGPKKKFTIDLLLGLTYIDTYPKEEDLPHEYLDYSSWQFALQGNYYFPISDSWDITAFAQAKMNFIENFCRYCYVEKNYYGEDCRDPFRPDATTDTGWEGVQWTFSVGVGIRFWKPKPDSWH